MAPAYMSVSLRTIKGPATLNGLLFVVLVSDERKMYVIFFSKEMNEYLEENKYL